MVAIDKNICTKCGICLSAFEGYCINSSDCFPVINYSLCNQCQKCIALCPYQAISINGIFPEKISNSSKIGYKELISLLSFRQSTKSFKKQDIPHDIIETIARSAKYAPNQNKNIGILIVNDDSIIEHIDTAALQFFKRIYKIMFALKPVTFFIRLFVKSLPVIKKKMERDLFHNKHIVKMNTNALLLAVGEPRVPVTEMSAQYLLAMMIVTATSLDIGCTLMDSIKIAVNSNKKLKRKLGIKSGEKVLGVLALGYSNEKIVNIPKGYEVPVFWNRIS